MSKPLHYWSLTVAEKFTPLCSEDRMDSVLSEFFAQWCYQGELGDKTDHRHYQCRVILKEPQRKQTLLSIFENRGFDARDITFLPESNKSIQQGGLSFYVMDDTKKLFLPFRCDPRYTIPRKKNWIPDMCKCIVDNPRPWMTTVLNILAGIPHHRQVIWICTIMYGGVAKSLFNTYLEAAGIAIYIGDGTPTQIKEAVISEGEHRAYTVDLPKTFAHDNRIGDYINCIETIKNGFVKTAMHGKRKKLVMNQRPHFIVFSNSYPPFNMMTEGRFNVFTIDASKDPGVQTLDPWSPPEYSQFPD